MGTRLLAKQSIALIPSRTTSWSGLTIGGFQIVPKPATEAAKHDLGTEPSGGIPADFELSMVGMFDPPGPAVVIPFPVPEQPANDSPDQPAPVQTIDPEPDPTTSSEAVELVMVQCAECEGEGCDVCGATGHVAVDDLPDWTMRCPICNAAGCDFCSKRGWLNSENYRKCPLCRGSGCRKCDSHGWVEYDDEQREEFCERFGLVNRCPYCEGWGCSECDHLGNVSDDVINEILGDGAPITCLACGGECWIDGPGPCSWHCQDCAGTGYMRDWALFGMDLTNRDLYGVEFSGADLSCLDFSGSDLSEADLSASDLTRTNFTGTILTKADLTGANLSDANPEEAADLTGTRMINVTG